MATIYKKCFEKLNLNKKYIIAVSGGPDSIFLLINLIQNDFSPTNIIVCHINYQKRTTADEETNYVKKLCEKLKIVCHIKYVLIDDIIFYQTKEKTKNFQSLARAIRYDFFEQIADKYNTNLILIAHQLNDVVENYIMQKKKKVLSNYYGLPYKRLIINSKSKKTYIVLRPLLKITKNKILQFLKQYKIKYFIDETNNLPLYSRNKIRLNLQKDASQIKTILQEIDEKNQANKIYQNACSLITKDGSVPLLDYKDLSVVEKQIILWKIIQNQKPFLLKIKKSSFLKEAVKQFDTPKKNLSFKITDGIFFQKNSKEIKFFVSKNKKIKH